MMRPNNIKNRIKSRLFNLQYIKEGSIPGIEEAQMNEPLSTSITGTPSRRKRFRNFLEKVPVLGCLIMWFWRLITLPSRFHRLSRHFEAEVQGQEVSMQMINHVLEDMRAGQENKNQEISRSIEDMRAGQENAIKKIYQSIDSVNDQIRQMNEIIIKIQEPVSLEDTLFVDTAPYLSGKDGNTDDENILYMTFENIFRGSEGDIDKRQRMYLGYIQESKKHVKDGKHFLDVGCGRGEFLKILKEADVPAKGIEINTSGYNHLKSQDFDVELADANTFLENIENNTLTGISCFQVVEHLPLNYLKKFIELAYRKTALNGVIILESVNTKCSVALSNFYLDPTHIKPYPPELLKFLLEWYEFKKIRIVYSSPCSEGFRVKDSPEHNYMDYAVIGWKK
jgi:SAM-dependent methyltransferase